MKSRWQQLIVAAGAVVLLGLAGAQAAQKLVASDTSALTQPAKPPAEPANAFVDAAETAMRVTEATATEAVDTIKEIYAIVGIVAAIAVSLAAFFGLREYRQLRKGGEKMVQDALRQAKAEFEQRLNEELESLRDTGLQRIHKATLISLDTSDLLRTLTDYKGSRDADERQYLRGSLILRFKDLEDNANALNNERTLSWVWAQRALMSYYEEDMSEAYRYQRMAVDADRLNHVDRHHNLAAIAARLYRQHQNRKELLSEAAKELEIVLREGSRWEVRNALTDPDLGIVFSSTESTEPTLRQRFEERAPGAADDGTG